MGAGFVLAWLVGWGIITTRSIVEQHMPPPPRELLVSSGLFALLAILGQSDRARFLAAAMAWGVDIAALLQVLPGGTSAITGSKNAGGWSSIGMAGNTVIFPDGTVASTLCGTTSTTADTTSGGGTSTSGAGPGGSASQNQTVAKQVIQQNSAKYPGWDSGQQWQCLVNLWNKESGWSANATNPKSGAYGIPQSLHGNKGGQGGNEFSSSDAEGLSASQLQGANQGNVADQEAWGLAYIATAYGTPCGAWAHEQAYGWY